MRYTPVDSYATRRLKIAVATWFDFELTSSEKMALLHVFPKLLQELARLYPKLVPLTQEPMEQPKNKARLLEAIVFLFLRTLGEPSRLEAEGATEQLKHHLQQEMMVFLRTVRMTSDSMNYRPSFNF